MGQPIEWTRGAVCRFLAAMLDEIPPGQGLDHVAAVLFLVEGIIRSEQETTLIAMILDAAPDLRAELGRRLYEWNPGLFH